jgi:hypothetical protein
MFKKRMEVQIRYFLFVSKLINRPLDEVVILFCGRFRRLYNQKHFNMR